MEAKTEENVDAIVNGIVELKTGEEKPVPVDVIPTPVSDLTELNGFRFVCGHVFCHFCFDLDDA
jgi:hypothetical protein